MNSLTYGATTLALPDDATWPDEHTWQAVEQRQQYSITGALIVEAASKQAGRPITVECAEDFGWMTRADIVTLRTWANLAGQQFTLLLRGQTFTVVFDHARGALDAEPVWDVSDPVGTDFYTATLRFLEV